MPSTEIEKIIARIDSLEKSNLVHESKYDGLWEKVIKLEYGLDGIRLQAKDQYEKTEKAITNLHNLIDASSSDVMRTLGRITTAFNMDKDPNAPYRMQKIFEYVENQMLNAQERNKLIRAKVVNWGVGIILCLLALGFYSFLDNRINLSKIHKGETIGGGIQ